MKRSVKRSRRAIIVLGMHRSGTSALARTLNLCGVDLGSNLMPPGPEDNVKGFWEHMDIYQANEKLLQNLGSSWDDVRALPDRWWTSDFAEAYKLEIISILERDFSNSPFWGVKDPRICRFLPLWHPILEQTDNKPFFLIIVRNPIEIVASLSKRDGFSKGKSCLLWLKHLIESEKGTRNSSRVFVTYEELLSDWKGLLTRVEKTFGFKWPKNPMKASSEIDAFLENSLRHNRVTDSVRIKDKSLSKWIKDAYLAVTGTIPNGDGRLIKTLDAIETELKEAVILYDPAFTDIWKKYLDNNDRLQERNQQVNDIKNRIEELSQEKRYLQSSTDQLQTYVKEKNEHIQQLDVRVKGLTTQLAERDETLTLLKDEISRIYKSKTWKLPKPLRSVRRIFSVIYLIIREYSSNIAHAIWHGLPLPVKIKLVFKSIIFKKFPFLFKHTFAYRVWHADEPYHGLHSEMVFIDQGEQAGPVSLLDADPLADVPVRLIAFYLPQFHPIPENDEWWGKGFTEWTSVKRSYPQFPGHYQPHVPGELGYYDLRNSKIQKRQVELAKLYGIGGFCFHFYWFAGKQLLELPIQQYVDDSNLDLPFCLCWANENWTRRWDGLDSDILITQDHSPEDDMAFIGYISRYRRDPRYIRSQGKPLLIGYRPILLPSAKKTAKRWRIWCRENDIGEIYLAYTQSFESVNPRKYGFDGAIEFPPNNTTPPVITSQVNPKDSDFSGVVYDWSIFVERSRKYQKPDYPLFRGICPAWDNTARRMENAGIFLGSTPGKYSEWLENASIETIRRFSDPSERLVFINAWNEWAEGAYLEPDQRYGYAYLQATRDALERINNRPGKRRIVLVAHDAHPHGAQNLILYMARALVKEFGFNVDMVVLGDGPLLDDYGRYGTLHMLSGKDAGGAFAKDLAYSLFAEGLRSAITNTAVTGLFAKILKEQGFNVVSLIHELPGIIKEHKFQPHIKSIAKHADWVVFPANEVKEGFNRFSQIPSERTLIRPQGLFRKNSMRSSGQLETARHNLRKKFNLPETAQIVLCVGYADHRKGIDLFVDIGLKVMQQNTNAYFIWVGHFGSNIESKIKKMINNSGFSGHFVFPGIDFQSDLYYAGSDIFALTSREDPFPSVVAEALDASLPVVAFDGAGGFTELLSRGGGLLVPAFDTTAFADALIDLMRSPENAHLLGQSGKTIVENELSFRRYVFDLLALAKAPLKRVSVIVPNYNYAKYLVERITSIANQEYPIYEIIILDDKSSDGSVQILNNLVPTLNVDCKLIVNESNSGSPFVQWLKGVELAQGDYVWIAEADDLSKPEFLSEVLKPFNDTSVVLSYCQSKQIDSQGKVLSENYLDYVSDISTKKWLRHYVEGGADEISSCLAIKNTVPNVSAVVFERKALLHVLKNCIEEIKQYRVAGDWQTYLSILKSGKIAFSPEPLNLHRRHQNSVTIENFNLAQLEEILAVQQNVRKNFQLIEEVVVKAQAYSQHLYKEFNLATRDAPILAKHRRLSAYLEDYK